MILKPFSLNSQLILSNRIAMAPMTRCMSQDDATPTDAMIPYYAKKADTGLIITEGTIISEDATGYRNVPGLFNQKHINAWRKITDAVHDKGGKIFCQLWHVGRVSHPDFLNGALPISSSRTEMTGQVRREKKNMIYGYSREASMSDIKMLIDQFVRSADCAMKAGFDGIELHGANGYLIDQFLHYDTNLRQDKYGGSAENMTRFLFDILSGIEQVMPLESVGIRLSPVGYLNQVQPSLKDSQVFAYLLNRLNEMNIAYVHTGAFDDNITYPALYAETMTAFIRQHYSHTLIACGSYDLLKAESGLENNLFDMVAFGRPFLSNPFLIQAIKANKAWRPYHVSMLETLD